jgi:hypothetical protein
MTTGIENTSELLENLIEKHEESIIMNIEDNIVPENIQNNIETNEIIEINPSNSKSFSFKTYLQNPFFALFIAFILAWIYTIIPNGDYWLYYFVKNQYWATLGLMESVEVETVNIPDAKERTYFLCYIIGFFSTILLHLIKFYVGGSHRSDIYVAGIGVCTPVLFEAIIFGIDCFQNPEVRHAKFFPKEQIFGSKKNPSEDFEISNQRKFRTMFAAIGEGDMKMSEAVIRRPKPGSVELAINPIHDIATIQQQQQQQDEEEHRRLQHSLSTDQLHNSIDEQILQQQFHIFDYKTWHNIKYYFPRYWNSLHFKEMNVLRNYDRRIIWFYTTCFAIVFCLNYIFLVIVTINFRQNTNLTTGVYLFVFFIIGSTFFRLLLKTIGSTLDSMKKLSISMYFLAEVACVLFYYTFYRVLFRSIDSLALFFIFQFLHLSSEWLLYVLRTSDWFFMKSEAWIEYYWKEDVYWSWLIQKPRFTNHEWQRLMTLDYGIRVVILISSTYSIILLLVTIQYFPWIQNDLQQDTNSFQFTMLLLCLALILESINAYIMNEIYFKPKKLDAIKEVKCCFQNISFGILSLFIGCNLFINPVFAFTSDNSFR